MTAAGRHHLGRGHARPGRRGGRAGPAGRRDRAGRRPRRGQDGLRAGLRPGAGRHRAHHQPHLHARPRATRAGCRIHHLDVYRLDQMSEALDLGLAEMLDEGGVVAHRVGRRHPPRRCPTTSSRCASASATDDDERSLELRPVGTRWTARRSALVGRPRALAARRDRLMLILGISTSTARVGCAIGGHEGILGAVHSSRGKRHAETLTPAIEFLCRQTRVDLGDIGAIAVDLGPGPVHRPAGRGGRRQGAGPRPPAADDRRRQPRPPRLRAAPLQPAHRLRHRRRAGRDLPRQLPAVARRRPAPHRAARRHGRRPGLRAGGRATRSCSWSATAPCATAAAFEGINRLELGDSGRGPPLGRLAGAAGPRPGAARGVRGPRAELTPMYLRKPDAEIGWSTRDGAPMSAALNAADACPTPDELEVVPHLDAAPAPARRAAHRAAGLPAAVVDGPVHERARATGAAGSTSSPASAPPSSATAA